VLQEKVKNLQAELLKIKNEKILPNLHYDLENNNSTSQVELIEKKNRLHDLLEEIAVKKKVQIEELEQKCKVYEESEERFRKTVLELKMQIKLKEQRIQKMAKTNNISNENENEEVIVLKKEVASLKKLLECNPQVTELTLKNFEFQGKKIFSFFFFLSKNFFSSPKKNL
jgi:hypothetical protein